jgi:hypothetical protein
VALAEAEALLIRAATLLRDGASECEGYDDDCSHGKMLALADEIREAIVHGTATGAPPRREAR